ncbi:MAG TPA: hypothetical protein VG708_10485 [Mycobacteriales bacterium]|nr:hypothetical protein [Mycobacteriales bacterium]
MQISLPDALPPMLWLTVGCAALVAIGTLLTWASVAFFSVNGVQTSDGKLVLVAALLAGASVVLVRKREGVALVATFLFGLVSFGTSLYDTIRILTSSSGDFFGAHIGVSVGLGLWLDVIAGAALLVSAGKWTGSRGHNFKTIWSAR